MESWSNQMPHVSKGDIHAYLDGALGAYAEDEADRIRQHLDECGVCAASLDEERQLRLVASEILAATAHAPLDLAPFEELVARAGDTGSAGPAGGVSRFRTLRMAATVVISLGAGWLARDLTGPASDLAMRPALDVVRAQEGVAARANEALNPFQVESESPAESVNRQAGQGDFVGRAVLPVQSQDLDPEAATPAASAALSDLSAPLADAPTSVRGAAPTPARMESAADIEAGRRDMVGGGLGLDQQRVSEALPQSAAVEPAERRRSEVAVPADVVDNRAVAGVARGVAATATAEELAKSDQDGVFADDANAVALNEMSITGRTTSFVIPGLSIRDVRVAGAAQGADPTVTIIQELPDGSVVELRFVPTAGGLLADGFAAGEVRAVTDEARGKVALREAEGQEEAERDALKKNEGILGLPLPEGWSQVVRALPDGLAIIRGPLGETELSELLDEALARR
jgi:hypothetical protein